MSDMTDLAFLDATAPTLMCTRDCIEAVQNVAALCADFGHEVEEASLEPNNQHLAQCFYRLWLGGVAWVKNWLIFPQKAPA